MTTTSDTLVQAPGRARPFSAEATALLERFPPRQIPGRWEGAEGDRVKVLGRLLAPPFCLDNAASQYDRRAGLIRVLDWLGSQPGSTWQDRWCASGAGIDGSVDWRSPALQWLKNTGRVSGRNKTVIDVLGPGLLQLICGDVIRPGIAWLLTSATPQSLAAEMARVRDVDGFAAIGIVNETSAAGHSTTRTALHLIAVIMAAKGGAICDITVGDCLELLEVSARECDRGKGHGTYFYQMLRMMGVFPSDAPPTVRMFNPKFQGQLTVEQLIDRYDIACRPVRDLLVGYLKERQIAVDFATLQNLAPARA